ncbi:MAG: ABC transporter permease subunit [Coriobacteriales bacterium]
MTYGRSRWRRVCRDLAAAAILLGVLQVPVSASALTNPKVTLDEETGGQPTRFTFTAVSDEDASLSEMVFIFPEGFKTAESTAKVTLLSGLDRVQAHYAQEPAADGTIRLVFTTPVPAGSNLFIELYKVVTPVTGGTYELSVDYTVETTPVVTSEKRTTEGVPFEYKTPARDEMLARWLDQQPWVKAWNSVKFLNIFLRPQQLVQAVPLVFEGWLLSIALVLVAFPIAIVGGLLTAFMKMAKIALVRWPASVYINVIRGTPLFLQIYVVFIGLRMTGIRFPDFASAVAVLAFNSSAYLAEIFRAGIQSISKGQFEAASSLGMTYWQAMRHVIIPQTVRRVLPTMTSEFILLFKDTALFAAVGIFELMMRSQNFVERTGNLSPYVVAACYYLIITIPLINLVGRLEARLAESEHGVSTAPHQRRRTPRHGDMLPGPTFETTAASHESR